MSRAFGECSTLTNEELDSWPGPEPDIDYPSGDLWVFGYGSLMWNPGFPYVEVRTARIHGYHRSLCIWSWVYRGTRRRPGLVLGLDKGGSCVGRALRVTEADKRAAIRYLYGREMVTAVYQPMLKAARLEGSEWVSALAFRAERSCPQYAGRLSVERAAGVVRGASGKHGENREYVANTVAQLRDMGIADLMLENVHELAQGQN